MTLELKLDRPLVVFDIESTGVNPRQDRIIELAAVKINPDGTEETQFTEYRMTSSRTVLRSRNPPLTSLRSLKGAIFPDSMPIVLTSLALRRSSPARAGTLGHPNGGMWTFSVSITGWSRAISPPPSGTISGETMRVRMAPRPTRRLQSRFLRRKWPSIRNCRVLLRRWTSILCRMIR